MKHHI